MLNTNSQSFHALKHYLAFISFLRNESFRKQIEFWSTIVRNARLCSDLANACFLKRFHAVSRGRPEEAMDALDVFLDEAERVHGMWAFRLNFAASIFSDNAEVELHFRREKISPLEG